MKRMSQIALSVTLGLGTQILPTQAATTLLPTGSALKTSTATWNAPTFSSNTGTITNFTSKNSYVDPYLVSQGFKVSTSGSYTLTANGLTGTTANNFNTSVFLYTSFNAANPLAGIIAGNNNVSNSNLSSSMTYNLTAGTIYYAAVSTPIQNVFNTNYNNCKTVDSYLVTAAISSNCDGTVAMTPEPSSIMALMAGGASLIRFRRRKRV